MEQRTCPVCRRNFNGKGNQRFCSPEQGKTRGYCARAYENAAQRGTLDKLLAEPRMPPVPFDCARCDRRCVPGENVAKHATKFCCARCKREWYREGKLSVALIESVTAPAKSKQVSEYRKVLRCDPCAYCGEQGGSIDHIQPRHHGGANTTDNLTGACGRCNGVKGCLSLLEALLWIPVARDYHDMREAFFSRP